MFVSIFKIKSEEGREEISPFTLATSRGRSDLVVRSRLWDRSVPSLKPGSTEDLSCMWACCLLNHMQGAKRLIAGVVRKFGEGCHLRCRPHHQVR
ncbi:hypothetical protein AVEN_69238-1 [Araneus ventricosus]|uniref:Uncharacterized protein n=1 Tax=Araneus ventricosus TaxID=182803 RepID=A0A4Y2ERQ5_ARAVE|nr:hypothetical protein AVEN_69238-1 [Araneus ventricosus]